MMYASEFYKPWSKNIEEQFLCVVLLYAHSNFLKIRKQPISEYIMLAVVVILASHINETIFAE